MGFETALIFYQILPTLGKCMEISQENLSVDIGGLKGGKETGRGSLCWETVENFRRH